MEQCLSARLGISGAERRPVYISGEVAFSERPSLRKIELRSELDNFINEFNVQRNLGPFGIYTEMKYRRKDGNWYVYGGKYINT